MGAFSRVPMLNSKGFLSGQSKTTILFVVEAATLAHVVRSLSLAQSLDRSRYEVIFACDHHFDSVLSNINFKRLPLTTRAPEVLHATLSRGGCLFDRTLIEKYVSEELLILKELKPALVVGDFRPSLGVSAVVSGVPYCNVTNAYWSPFAKNRRLPFPCIGLPERLGLKGFSAKVLLAAMHQLYLALLPVTLKKQGSGLDEVRKAYGLTPFEDYFTGFTYGDYVLYADLEELVPTSPLPHNHRYLGPLSWSPPGSLPEWWSELDHSKPLVYVCLGSSGSMKALGVVVDALAQMLVQAVIATAGRATFNDLPGNIRVAQFLPGDLVVSKSRLVIGNGGSPIIYQALKGGVPVLSVPDNMDQLLASSYAQKAKVGLSVRSDIINRRDVIYAANRLLKDPIFLKNARRLKAACQLYDPYDRFRNIIDEILVKENKHERVSRVQSM